MLWFFRVGVSYVPRRISAFSWAFDIVLLGMQLAAQRSNALEYGTIYGIINGSCSMPKEPALLPKDIRPTDILTATHFATVFPLSEVRAVLESCGRSTVRVRNFPNEGVIYFVMMLALFRDCAHREVFRIIADALKQLWRKRKIVIPTAAALSQARTRVGFEPFQILFERLAVPVAVESTKGAWFKGLRKIAIDGCLLNTDDSKENRNYFGCSKNQHKTASSFPQARFVGLLEISTHLFFKAVIGGYHDGEITLGKQLIRYLTKGMILLADRNFYSFDFFQSVKDTGSEFVVRIQRGMKFTSVEQLPDHSDIVLLHPSNNKEKRPGIRARLIQYRVLGSNEKVYLLTTILDPQKASAQELAELYHERWEYEGALKQLKTVLNDSATTLRSKTPALVIQELWGLLMTHYVVSLNMFRAASRADLDPDELSFKHSVHVISRSVYKATSDFSPCEQIEEDFE